MAPQEAIVAGFDAVPASEVRKARPTVATSPAASSPARTWYAATSVRIPSQPSTMAPVTPSATRNGSMVSSEAAPPAPRAA